MHRVPHQCSVGNKPGEYLILAEPNDVSQILNLADVILILHPLAPLRSASMSRRLVKMRSDFPLLFQYAYLLLQFDS